MSLSSASVSANNGGGGGKPTKGDPVSDRELESEETAAAAATAGT